MNSSIPSFLFKNTSNTAPFVWEVRTLVWPDLWPQALNDGSKQQVSMKKWCIHHSDSVESTKAWHLGPTCSDASGPMMHYSSADNEKNGKHPAFYHKGSVIAMNRTSALLKQDSSPVRVEPLNQLISPLYSYSDLIHQMLMNDYFIMQCRCSSEWC